MIYEKIRPLAFRPASPDSIPTQPFQKLCFPRRWYSELSRLWKSIDRNKGKKYLNLPLKSLNSTLRAVVPDLIYVLYPNPNNNVWIYSSRRIDTNHLLHIVRAWAEVSLKDVPGADLNSVIHSFDANELQWQHCELQGEWGYCPNGTAKPTGEFFSVLPYFLAAQLSNEDFEIGNEILRFKRFPLTPGSNGAEIMSWPPLWHEEKKDSGYYALYIKLSIQTIPFHPEPLLYIHAGTRRFVGPDVSFTRDIKSAVIYTSIPWLKGLSYENSFQVTDVVTRKKNFNGKSEDVKDAFELRWDDNLIEILKILNIGNSLPLARDLLNQKENYAFGNTQALLLHNTSVGSHAVATGLSPADRSALFSQLREKLGASWNGMQDFPRVPTKVSFIAKNPFDSSNKKATPQMRIERIKAGLGNGFELWICYERDETKEAMLNELSEQLGFPCKEGSNNIPIDNTFYKIDIRCSRVNEIGDQLNYQPGARPGPRKKEQAYWSAVNSRIQQISTCFPPRSTGSKPAGVLFELRSRDKFLENSDPKEAIRQGLAQLGYLSQFINTNEKSKTLSHRASKALLDLFRQLGVLPFRPAINTKMTKLSGSLNFIGIWIIRFNNRFGGSQTELPIAIHLSAASDQIMVKLPNRDWQPYNRAQLELAKQTYQDTINRQNFHTKEQRHQGLKEWLLNLLDNLPDETILITNAQNLRGVWNDIQNGNLAINKLSLNGMFEKSLSEKDGLRLVRIREDQLNEAPFIFTFNHKNDDESEVGLTQGVYAMTERVFASVGAKPKTAQVTAKSSKFGPFNTRSGTFQASPGHFSWNPRVCELTVYGIQDEDVPAIWASIVHELRKMSLQFDDITTLPLPLHLASKLEEYVGK